MPVNRCQRSETRAEISKERLKFLERRGAERGGTVKLSWHNRWWWLHRYKRFCRGRTTGSCVQKVWAMWSWTNIRGGEAEPLEPLSFVPTLPRQLRDEWQTRHRRDSCADLHKQPLQILFALLDFLPTRQNKMQLYLPRLAYAWHNQCGLHWAAGCEKQQTDPGHLSHPSLPPHPSSPRPTKLLWSAFHLTQSGLEADPKAVIQALPTSCCFSLCRSCKQNGKRGAWRECPQHIPYCLICWKGLGKEGQL